MSHIARSLKQSNKKKRTEHSIIQITNKHITDHKSTPGEKKKKKEKHEKNYEPCSFILLNQRRSQHTTMTYINAKEI